jgi:hypothetical protein
MSREVRRVPPGWKHPRNAHGNYIPLYEGPFSQRAKEWDEEAAMWAKGKRRGYGDDEWVDIEDEYKGLLFEDWDGPRPEKQDYMPEWDEGECTHFMMYETCTEGTPISPAFPTPEELARWLVDNNASAFARQTATYEQWLRVCRGGYAPSAMLIPGKGIVSGVAALAGEVLDE